MRVLRNVRTGMIGLVDPFVAPRKYVQSGGFAADHQKLLRDVRTVGSDLVKAMARREQRTHAITRD